MIARTPDAQGDFSRYPLPRLLYYLYKKAFLGLLEVRWGQRTIEVFFRDGLATFCSHAWPEDVLGRVLLERGWITQQAYEASLQELAQGGRLHGQILLERGELSKKDLIKGLRLQLFRKLNRLFHATDAAFSIFNIEHQRGLSGEERHVRADPLWVIHHGVRNAYNAQRLAPELARLDGMVVGLRPEFGRLRQRYGFAESDAPLLETLHRAPLPVAGVFAISDLGPVETQMVVYTLWVTEALICRQAQHSDRDLPRAEPAAASVPPPAEDFCQSPKTAPQISTLAHQFAQPNQGTDDGHESADAVINIDAYTDPPATTPDERDAPLKPLITPPPPADEAEVVPATPASDPPAAAAQSTDEVRIADLRQRLQRIEGEIEQQNHFEVLGIGRDASGEAIRNAYFELAKVFHPDRVRALGVDELSQQAEQVFRRINEAHGVLTDPEQRKKYERKLDNNDEDDAGRAALEAEFTFQKALVLFRKKAFSEARELFKEALRLAPREGEHLAWVAWSIFCDPRKDRSETLPRLKQQLLEATNLSPKNPTCHYFLGEIYLALDDTKRALTCFNRTLELKPEHTDAQRHVRLIRMRREKAEKKGGKGLLRKLRGR